MVQDRISDAETGKYLAHLVKSALDNSAPRRIPDTTDWKKVFFAVKKNSLEGITFLAVEKMSEKPADKLFEYWKDVYQKLSYIEFLFENERNTLFAEMRKAGLSYLPLKGVNFLRFYPKPGMRSMGDNDILYGLVEQDENGIFHIAGETDEEREKTLAAARERLVEIMKSLGFEVGSLLGHDERFMKGPLLFEMHRSLVPSDSVYFEYYKNSWKRALRSASDPNRFAYSQNDEYIYTVVHIDKHLKTSGTGLRSIVDLYVFLKNVGAELDREYIDAELKKLGVFEVEERLRNFAFSLFEADSLSAEDEELLLYFLNCGTYGNFDEMMRLNLKRLGADGNRGKAKAAYVKKRLSKVSEAELEIYFPVFYRHRFLRPFLPVHRIFRGMFTNTRYFFREVGYLFSRKKDKKDSEKKDI